jgi:hypothetical protein
VTTPVEVDPAPPDLATGLDALAGAAGSARVARRPLLLVAADLQVHAEALADLAEDPRPATAALVSRSGAARPGLRVRAGRVVATATPSHRVADPDTCFAGALRVAVADLDAAEAAAAELATAARRHGWAGDPLGYLLLGLVRTGVRVGTVSLDPWRWARDAADPARSLQAELDAMDPRAVAATRFARATKSEDGFVATFLSRPLSRLLTPTVLRLGLTPNQVTLASVVVGLGAAALFAVGRPAALVAGAVLLQLSLVLDCVDGDVARYTRRFSPLGAWLDASTDRLKEFACYAGLAWGADAGRTGWVLAATMITLQTARHSVDYTFTAVKDLREAEVVQAPLDQEDEPVRRGAGDVRAARALELSRRSSAARPAVTWLKKVLHLGIGERWLVISVLAAAQQPLAALAVLLVLGAGSLLYTSAGRTLRARSWPAEPVLDREREIVLAQVDGGPLVPATAAGRFAGRPGGRERFLWVRPALLRAGEYLAVLGLTAGLAGAGPGAAVCVLLLVVASHHYDDLYRVLNRLRPPSALSRVLGLGVAGRLVVVAVLALLGSSRPAVGEGGLWVLAGWLGILYLLAEPARVLREVRSPVLSAGGPTDVPTEGAVGA